MSDVRVPDNPEDGAEPMPDPRYALQPAPRGWPAPLGPEALYGLAGRFVETIGPHTEADPASLLVQFLVAAGSLIGRGPYYRQGRERHRLNLFAALVGQSSKGRKGTSWGEVAALIREFDQAFMTGNVANGLSTGEGLIYRVRDADPRPPKRDGDVPDPGVSDKRLLVVEGELARVLKVMTREGNTLSPIVRCAWDGDILQTMTRAEPLRATDAYVAIVGHITQAELRRRLTETEAANGFGNRFLWVCVRRARLLPDGGSLDDRSFWSLALDVQRAVESARKVGEVTRSEGASCLWRTEYPRLSFALPGMLGSMTSRAEAQVLRLSVLYAVLDGSSVVDPAHLRAAIAVWDYCLASARYLFGTMSGDTVAERIYRGLAEAGAAGLSRTEIRDLLGRNLEAARIESALSSLEQIGRARRGTTETGGRPAEVWQATTETTETTEAQ